MARISKEDILELSNEELLEKIVEESKLYRDKKFAHTITPLENPMVLKDMRRNIARLKTELTKRQQA